MVTALRTEFDANTATNRAALEAAIAMIRATADVLTEIKGNSKDYADTLWGMLRKTDETMRSFTEVLLQSGAEAVTRADRLSHALPAIEARAQVLATAADRITAAAEDLRPRRPRRSQREAVD